MRVVWATLCREIVRQGTKADIRGAGSNVVTVEDLPTTVSVKIAVLVGAPRPECGQQIGMWVEVYSPSSGPARHEQKIILPPAEPAHPPDWEAAIFNEINVSFDIGEASENKRHVIALRSPGEPTYDVPFLILLTRDAWNRKMQM